MTWTGGVERTEEGLGFGGTHSPCSYGGGGEDSGCLPRSLHRRYTVRPTAVPIRAALNAVETIEPASVRRRLAGGKSATISSISSSSFVFAIMSLYFAGVSRYPLVEVGIAAAWLGSESEGTHPRLRESGGKREGEGGRRCDTAVSPCVRMSLLASRRACLGCGAAEADSCDGAENGLTRPGTVSVKLKEKGIA